MARLPRIGVTTSLNDGEQRLARDYILAIERAGGLPLPVPMLATPEAAQAFAELLDGLVITGGPAVTDGLIGTLPDDISETAPERIESDRSLLEHALVAELPTLGICYGMQLASALAGGTIFADVQAHLAGVGTHSEKRGGADHVVHVEPGTLLHRMLNTTDLVVNTRHIQAVAEPGMGYRVSARAPDGVIEAIEREDGLVIGVQFHPERMGAAGHPIFANLVEQAKRRTARRVSRSGELSPPSSA